MFLLDLFKKVKSLLEKVFQAAKDNGLSDEILDQAYRWAKVAAARFVDNTDRREFVVKMLVARNIPESVARFAVEAAVQLLKKELAGNEAKSNEL